MSDSSHQRRTFNLQSPEGCSEMSAIILFYTCGATNNNVKKDSTQLKKGTRTLICSAK